MAIKDIRTDINKSCLCNIITVRAESFGKRTRRIEETRSFVAFPFGEIETISRGGFADRVFETSFERYGSNGSPENKKELGQYREYQLALCIVPI